MGISLPVTGFTPRTPSRHTPVFSALVGLDLGGVFQQGHPLFDEVVLWGEDHVGGAEEGVGAGGEDDDVVAGGGFEGDFGAGGAADPVFLLGLDAVDEVQVVQVVDEALCVLGNFEHPLALLLADDGASTALADAIDDLLVGQYALAGGTPVDGHGGLVGQTLLVELEKNPLGPFVVVRVGGVHDAVPVKAEAQHFELFGEMGDVVFGDHGGMDVVFDGVVLGGEAEGIEAHGEKDVVAIHALFAGDDVHGGVGAGVAHVEALPGGVGELDEAVELGLVTVVPGGEDLVLLPFFLPFGFDGGEIVFQFSHTLSYVVRIFPGDSCIGVL